MTSSRLLAAILATTAMASLSYGQDATRNTLTLSPYAGYQFKSSYGESELSIAREGVDLQDAYAVTDRFRLIANVKFEDSVYDFNDFRHESPGVKTPIDHAELLRFYPQAYYVINDKWAVTGGLIGQASGQTGALFNDSFTYGVVGLVIYKVSDRLSIGAGGVFYTQLEDDSAYLPLASIDWKISDQWLFTGKGTEARISYFVRPEVDFYLASSYDTRQYRLEDGASYSSGVLNDNVVPVRLGVQWLPTDGVTVAGEIGAIAWQELTFDDSDGHRIVKDHVDPTVFIGFTFSYRF